MFCINSTKYQSCHVQSAYTNDLFLPNPLDKRSALSTQVSEFTRQKRFQMEHARHAESSRSGISLGQLCSESPQSQLSHSTHSSWSVQCEYRTPKDGKGGRSGAPLRALSGDKRPIESKNVLLGSSQATCGPVSLTWDPEVPSLQWKGHVALCPYSTVAFERELSRVFTL